MLVFLVIILKFEIAKNVANMSKRVKNVKRKQQLSKILSLVRRTNLLWDSNQLITKSTCLSIKLTCLRLSQSSLFKIELV